jgi:ATP-dependent Clp endopeptidase proteolytic subunit ClpP
MNNDIYLIGGVGNEITLQNVIDKVNNSNKSKPLNVFIHSGGGSVYEGIAVYNYFKGLKQEVNTISSGLVASIASIIFLAGKKDTRKINNTDNFLIHLPKLGLNMGGNAEDLEKNAKELRNIEDKLSTIYANETNISKETALELMNKDEMMDVNFLKENGFVSEIVEFQAVATLENNSKNNMSEQLTKKDAENLFEKFFNKFFNPQEQAPDNKVIQDATGVEIDFVNLAKDDAIIEGAEAKVDGKKAAGDYTLPNGDVYKFENGKLDSIVTAEVQEVENLKNDLQGQKDLVSTLEAEKVELTNELETNKTALEGIKNEFTELKNTVTSSFDADDTVTKPNEEIVKGSRTNFKSKFK